jgi:hypothetical protein
VHGLKIGIVHIVSRSEINGTAKKLRELRKLAPVGLAFFNKRVFPFFGFIA